MTDGIKQLAQIKWKVGGGEKEISSISNKVEQNGMAWNGLGNPQNDKLGINCEMEWDGMV